MRPGILKRVTFFLVLTSLFGFLLSHSELHAAWANKIFLDNNKPEMG